MAIDNATTTNSAPKAAQAEAKRGIAAYLAGIPTDNRPSFADTMRELTIAADLLIDRLQYTIDTAANLGADYGEDGWYTVNALNETRWIAQRLSEEVTKVGREFKGSRSDRGSEFAQAAE